MHRESLCAIIKTYGIPDKITRSIRGIYEKFECAVIEENESSEWFQIKTGVKQKCVMSGFLFLLAIDWVMKKTTARVKRGIRWDFSTTLEDLDFADDIVLLSSKFQDLNDKNKRMIEEASRIGLKLSAKKCKTLTEFTRNEKYKRTDALWHWVWYYC